MMRADFSHEFSSLSSQSPTLSSDLPIVIIGGGPAGLMAASELTAAGYSVDLYDAMPSVGRKFLLAGIGGLNISHSEPFDDFCSRFDARSDVLRPMLEAFDANAIRQWCQSFGVETFIGTSGRIFPKEMKAAPLLRAWLTQLRQQGLRIHPRHRWLGWDEQQQLVFSSPDGQVSSGYQAVVLALGGASWKKLGSDGSWVSLLAERGIETNPLKPANCGFLSDWSEHLRSRFAGSPLKSVSLQFTDLTGQSEQRLGEMILSEYGVEGSLIYAFSARLRETILATGSATFYLDLCPHHSHQQLETILESKPAKKSLGAFLKGRLKLDGVKSALVFEVSKTTAGIPAESKALAALIKAVPITITGMRPIDEAISTAGGVPFEALDEQLMLKQLPGVFCAGEMLDWEAPTGGYLLTACLATGKHVGQGVMRTLKNSAS
jgi:uncharacterized flavoprotein (TIGR03862 family)